MRTTNKAVTLITINCNKNRDTYLGVNSQPKIHVLAKIQTCIQ